MNYRDVTFMPSWWNERGFSFDEGFFIDENRRMRQDREMRRVLFDEYGHCGLGEKEPKLRPLMDTDLLAGEYLQAQLLGCEIEFFENALPYTKSLELDVDGLEGLSVPVLEDNAVWHLYSGQFERLINRFGRAESYIDLCGVQNLALAIRGYALFEDYYEAPQAARKTLGIACETIIAAASAISRYTPHTGIGIGVSAILGKQQPDAYLTSNCSCDMVSSQVYEEFLLPMDAELAARFRPFGIHHCGQSMENLAEAYSKLSPEFIEIGANSDIEAVLAHFPKDTRVNLRFDPVALLTKTPDEIRRAVHEMLRKAEGYPHISISSVGVDAKTDKNCVEALLIM